MSGGVTTELDQELLPPSKQPGSFGPLGSAVKRLNKIHESLKSQRASGQLTDAEYAKEAGGLLNILSNFDGLIAEAASPRA